MSTLGTALTVADIIKLGIIFWLAWGRTQGMSKEELDKIHIDVRKEFLENDPALLIIGKKESCPCG